MRYFFVCDGGFYGMCGHQIGATDHIGLGYFIQIGYYRTYVQLYFFGRDFTHLDIVLLAQIILNIVCENISCGTYAVLHNQTAKRDDGDFGGAASYIHHHIAIGLKNLQAYA